MGPRTDRAPAKSTIKPRFATRRSTAPALPRWPSRGAEKPSSNHRRCGAVPRRARVPSSHPHTRAKRFRSASGTQIARRPPPTSLPSRRNGLAGRDLLGLRFLRRSSNTASCLRRSIGQAESHVAGSLPGDVLRHRRLRRVEKHPAYNSRTLRPTGRFSGDRHWPVMGAR